VETAVTVLGYGILVGAAINLTNCDTSDVIDVTSWSTVAQDGQSIAIVLPADVSRIQGLYTLSVVNAPPKEHQSDELVCAFNVLAGAPPTVTAVTPSTAFAGTPGDGLLSDTLVNIEGTGFAATPTVRWVKVDGSAFWEANEVAYVSETQLTAIVPSESNNMDVGDYNVYVTNPNKLGARWLVGGADPGVFTITGSAPPRIDDVFPGRVEQSACITQPLTISGSNFHLSAGVYYMIEEGICDGQIIDANGSILCPMFIDSRAATTLVAHFAVCPGNGLWPIAVMNPDGQTDYFFSVLVTNSSDGHLNGSDFKQLSSSLEQPRWRHAAEYGFDAFGRAHIYVAGGQGASGGVLDTVEMSELNVFGRPGPFSTTMQYLNADEPRVANTLSLPLQGAAMVRVGRDLFVLGGATTRTDIVAAVNASDVVQRARILGYEQMPSVKKPSFVKGEGLPNGTWFYRVSALGPWGEGLSTKEMAVYGGGGEITVCWGIPAEAGVTGYNVYRSAAADGRSGTTSLIAVNVQGTCFTDDGSELLAPAPARLRGAPGAGAGLAVGTYHYVVTAVVPVAGHDAIETVGSYSSSVGLVQTDVDAGNAAVTLNWDLVPGQGVTYHIYRFDDDAGEYLRLSATPQAETSFLDSGVAAVEPAQPLVAPLRPLPAGSLSLWTELDAEQFLLSPREGVEAIVVQLDPESEEDPVARIIAAGGRSSSGNGAATYLDGAESIAVYADGTLDATWLEEAPVLNTPRSHYALVTTQGRDATDFPPEGEDPPCPDFDGDGYIDCACAEVDDLDADCDDHNIAIHPDAVEVCGDGIDQNCDGSGCGGWDLACLCEDDVDEDGHISVECGGDDCCDAGDEVGVLGCAPDTAAGIHPGALEACGDDIDQNCDGLDSECACVDDVDGDGHLSIECGGDDCCDNGADTSLGCTDLTAALIYSGAKEYCQNGVDEDCDGEDSLCVITSADLPGLRRTGGAVDTRLVPGRRVPRTLAGGEAVYVIAVMGDSDWPDIDNGGLSSFEACPVDADGHLVSATGSWYVQNVTSNQPTFGLDAVLYFQHLYPFWGSSTEDYDPASSIALKTGTIRRYGVTDPDSVTPGNEDDLLGTGQSASTQFVVPRSHYKMLRLMSYIYVIGGWAGAHQDLDGNTVPLGPTGEIERHIQ
jgi:hypothetical protein